MKEILSLENEGYEAGVQREVQRLHRFGSKLERRRIIRESLVSYAEKVGAMKTEDALTIIGAVAIRIHGPLRKKRKRGSIYNPQHPEGMSIDLQDLPGRCPGNMRPRIIDGDVHH